MKKAKLVVAAVDVLCPSCGECIPEPASGALFFTIHDLRPGQVVECLCGEKVEIPKSRLLKVEVE